MTGMAVTLGRIEESQKYMRDAIDKLDSKVGGVAETVAAHSLSILEVQTKVQAHDRILEDRKPLRTPWPTIGAFVVAVCAIGWNIAQQILSP